ncbi:hypothetical protein [Bacillus xiapuensis]|uniref:Uncharacterized protein n=1 Tax=Bacillus xiapuensis TaxID=2014075 RepID=A0ABU6N831_9BACI|nr:hypothetical protein [Bacillus xiapuensis]
MKEFLYNSWFGYELSQMRWFRKWYGGEWNKVIPRPFPYMWLWIHGKPSNIEKVTDTEIYVGKEV